MDDRDGWIDPLRDSWQKINIEACTSLESIHIPIYFGPRSPKKTRQKALASPIAHLLKHVSPTLRRVTIELRDLYHPTTITSTRLLKLHELDEVVVVDRFPKLEHLRLEVYATYGLCRDSYYWSKCADAGRRALPNLHARRQLVVWNITPWTYTF
ncbi:hypothetical protein C8Q76DRAFT_724434 [Earliella scabrosa]|nr:hypothetical protein C8Q76DRAFT_724434 [Earliella scabrosa]